MRWLVVICMVGSVKAPLPPFFEEIAGKVAVWVFKQFLKSTVSDDGIGNLFSLRGLMPSDVNPEEHSGKFQGDIILDDYTIEDMVNQFALLRNALVAPDSQWPNNTVVWQFNNGDFDEEQRAAIQDAMSLIESMTCVRFRKRGMNETVYLNIVGNITGCYSMVGYREARGMHIVNFAPNSPGSGCFKIGTLVHELMHVLGFYHMHCTFNRDEFVRIVTENIRPGMLAQFVVYDSVSDLGVEYDYLSCLHYSPYAFSKNGNVTIEALKELDGVMGQRQYITDSDWLRINRHYDCPGSWDSKEKESHKDLILGRK